MRQDDERNDEQVIEAGLKRKDGVGMMAGDPCGLVRGKNPPCKEVLGKGGRCRLHCRTPTRNEESVGELCSQWHMRGGTGCKRHGGAARKGTMSPVYKDGRWSKYAPARYRDIVKAVQTGDPLDLTDDIGMVGARIAELFSTMGSAPQGEGLKNATELVEKCRKAVSDGEDDIALSVLHQLAGLLTGARAEAHTWDKVVQLYGQRVKMVESQRKRAIEGNQYIAVDDAMRMFQEMAASLKGVAEAMLDKAEADKLLTGVNAAWQKSTDTQVQDGGVQ